MTLTRAERDELFADFERIVGPEAARAPQVGGGGE